MVKGNDMIIKVFERRRERNILILFSLCTSLLLFLSFLLGRGHYDEIDEQKSMALAPWWSESIRQTTGGSHSASTVTPSPRAGPCWNSFAELGSTPCGAALSNFAAVTA